MAEDTRASSSLSPSAAIALLTLQLRAAIHEADTAEAAVDAIDLDRARVDLKMQLDAIRADRKASLDAELVAERETAEGVLASARAEADQILAAARLHAAELAKAAPVPEPELIAEPLVESVVEPEPVVVTPAELIPITVGQAHDNDEVALRASVETALAQVATTPAPGSGPLVTIDSEAFARVFATVLATVLDERFAAWRSTAPVGALPAQSNAFPIAPTVPAKRSGLRKVFQLDTVLMVLAGAIAIVLLFAWLG